jgi:guanosine-3',5'-bis(diphosphate) 3'-pyrophosphohydrolase
MKNIKLELCKYSESLLDRIHELNKRPKNSNCHQVDIEYIKKGLSFAKYYHGSQMRKSGEPYYSHPIAVAEMVANQMFREHVIIGALLHDTLEDTALTLDEIECEFSPRIAEIVDRLTRKIDHATGKKMSAGECLLKAMQLGDDETMLIKIFDRNHNIMTIDSMSREKQIKILEETLKDIILSSFYIGNIDLEHLLVKISQSRLNQKKQNDLISSSYY